MFTAKEYARTNGVCVDISSYLAVVKCNDSPYLYLSSRKDRFKFDRITESWGSTASEMLKLMTDCMLISTAAVNMDDPELAWAYDLYDVDDIKMSSGTGDNVYTYRILAAHVIRKVVTDTPGVKALYIHASEFFRANRISPCQVVKKVSEYLHGFIAEMLGKDRVLKISYVKPNIDPENQGVLILIDDEIRKYINAFGFADELDPEFCRITINRIANSVKKISNIEKRIPARLDHKQAEPEFTPPISQYAYLDSDDLIRDFIHKFGYIVDVDRIPKDHSNMFPNITCVLGGISIGRSSRTLAEAYENIEKLLMYIAEHANGSSGEWHYNPVAIKPLKK